MSDDNSLIDLVTDDDFAIESIEIELPNFNFTEHEEASKAYNEIMVTDSNGLIAECEIDNAIGKCKKKKRKIVETSNCNEKQDQTQRNALLKKLHSESQKQKRPGECQTHVTVVFDQRFLDLPNGLEIVGQIRDADYNVCAEKLVVQNCVRWRRETLDYGIEDSSQEIVSSQTVITEKDVLVVIQHVDFVNKVAAEMELQSCSTTNLPLSVWCQSMCDLLNIDSLGNTGKPSSDLSLVVVGLQKYFLNLKTITNRQHRKAVLEQSSASSSSDSNCKSSKTLSNVKAVVTSREIEDCLVNIQFSLGTVVRFVENSDELGQLIVGYSKAIAERPFRLDKKSNSIFSFYAEGDWAKGVKILAGGQGQLKVWKQMLMQFQSVSSEIASAIISKYTCPRALLKAYQQCNTEKEKENLLSNLTVRRGGGILQTTRRVGPHISARIFKAFSSEDGLQLIT